MLIDRSREKLLNAVVFFARNTSKCGKVKLFKLIYHLDFEHYKQTGRTVTGLKYEAWRSGPVPVELDDEFDSPADDFLACVNLLPTPTAKGPMIKVQPKVPADLSHFTRRETDLLHRLAEIYRDTEAEVMIEETHQPGTPWYRVYRQQGRKLGEVPPEYVLPEGADSVVVSELAADYEEFVENYSK